MATNAATVTLVTLNLDSGTIQTTLGNATKGVQDFIKGLGELTQELAKHARSLSDRGTAEAIARQAAANAAATVADAAGKDPAGKDAAKDGLPNISATRSTLELLRPEKPGDALLRADVSSLTVGKPEEKKEPDKTPFQKKQEEIDNQTATNVATAQLWTDPARHDKNFDNLNSAVDVKVAQLYYEYSLSMEERLKLARADALKGLTDGFAGMINGVLFGHQQIGDSFRKMVGNMAQLMQGLISKYLAQQAVAGLFKLFGLGNPFEPPATKTVVKGLDAPVQFDAPFEATDVLLAHDGGIVGATPAAGQAARTVPDSLFADAPRPPDGGLIRGEVPIIARQGEAVFTPEQMTNADQLLKSALTMSAGPQVNQTVNVTVNGNGGTPEQNNDLADRVGRQVRDELRGLMAEELRQQMRPGGMLNGGY